MQIFLRTFGGKHRLLSVESSNSVDELQLLIHALEGIPVNEQRLVFNSRLLEASFGGKSLGDCGIQNDSTVHLFLRLCGGKGGFGANLRATGKQKLTDNFDACRDLQGRRIRHKTAAEKLEEWQAEAHERELEKIALKHLKEREKQEKRQKEVEVDVASIRQSAKETIAGVQDAVQYALMNSKPGVLRGTRENGVPNHHHHQQQKIIPNKNKQTKGRRMDAMLLLGDEDGSGGEDDTEDEDEGTMLHGGHGGPPKKKQCRTKA